MKLLVKCTLLVPIEVPDNEDYSPHFDIEDNHCPGTGIVGRAIQDVMEECERKRICWACKLQGENLIVREER